MQVIDVNVTNDFIAAALFRVQNSFGWLFQWGMYLFILATIAIALWIFFDSTTKKKDQKSLIPRILSMIGVFAIIPAFIFRFTGTADFVTTQVRLNAEPGPPFPTFQGRIDYNVNWLISGYDSIIAIVALLGIVISIAALVIYASTIQRARPSTEFVGALNNKFSELERQVSSVKQNAPTSGGQTMGPGGQKSSQSGVQTVFDRKPQAATIIEKPQSGSILRVISGSSNGQVYSLPASDVKIGRDSTNFVVLQDGKASREHAKLFYNGNDWLIIDLGSANGTYLNDTQITAQVGINNGDIIRIGDTSLQFSKVG
jgi:hypothetical protein